MVKIAKPVKSRIKALLQFRDELIIVNNIVLKGSKIVLLSTLMKEMKQILHTGHLGIDKIECHINSKWTQY